MSEQTRAGKTIRQSYAAFWKEWIILAIGLGLILQPGLVTGWIEANAGAEIFNGLPATRIIQGAGLLAVIYAVIYKIGYDLLANRYTLTDEEVVEVYGIIQKNRRVTKLEHIRRVSVEIGIVGRILGFGDVLYFTAGSGGVDVRLKDIPNPEGLAQEADALARQKQSQLSEEGGSAKGGTRGESGAAASGGILDAFSEVSAQNAELQQKLLSTLQSVLDEERKQTRFMQAMASKGYAVPAGTSGQSDAGSPDDAHETIRQAAATERANSQSDGDAQDSAGFSEPEFDLESDALDGDGEDVMPESSGEHEEYEPSPKMFSWEDALAPSPRSQEEHEEEPEVKQEIPEEPEYNAASYSDSQADSEADSSERGEAPESEPDSKKRSAPIAEGEFVGLMAPVKK